MKKENTQQNNFHTGSLKVFRYNYQFFCFQIGKRAGYSYISLWLQTYSSFRLVTQQFGRYPFCYYFLLFSSTVDSEKLLQGQKYWVFLINLHVNCKIPKISQDKLYNFWWKMMINAKYNSRV